MMQLCMCCALFTQFIYTIIYFIYGLFTAYLRHLCTVNLVISALDCQTRGPGFKSRLGQKFGSRLSWFADIFAMTAKISAFHIERIAFIHSFILDISILPLQVHYYSEALPTQQG